MARQASILMPELKRQFGNMNIQRPPVSDSSNTFLAKSLVYLSSGALAAIATAGVLCYGQTPDGSHLATDAVPAVLFGENHYVFSPLDAEFEINVGAVASSTDVQVGAGAKTPGDVVIGTKYGIYVPTTGIYAGVQFLDPTNTSNLLFQVVGKVDNVLDTDYNGRVRVKIVPSTIQN